MCVSLTENTVADFSNTLLYAAEAIHPELQKTVHVLGYQNTVRNNADKRPGLQDKFFKNLRLFNPFSSSSEVGSGNAMILPFPAKPGTMSKLNIIDTESFPNFLTDITDAVVSNEHYVSFSSSSFAAKQKIEIFEAAGIYTVILAQNIKDIPEALSEIPVRKRPNPNPAIFEAYAEWYPDWAFALCCFNNEDKEKALPMLWWYEPMFSDVLFLPALDSHDGNVPQLDAQVELDHIIAVGSNKSEKAEPGEFINFKFGTVDYSDYSQIPPNIRNFLMNNVLGKRFRGELKNGDFYFRLSEVREGDFKPIRHFSPNAVGITG